LNELKFFSAQAVDEVIQQIQLTQQTVVNIRITLWCLPLNIPLRDYKHFHITHRRSRRSRSCSGSQPTC
jgi:hypothetical protein